MSTLPSRAQNNPNFPIYPSDGATYLDYFQKFIVRWNELLPEIPLYCNEYHTFFPDWLKNYNESSLWDFQKAIVYASIEGAE